jgi:hypothetical protein
MATRMQQRRGTAAQWISTNSGNGPILNAGEIGYETDTNKFKIGDGTNHWINLDYFIDASSTVNPAFGSSITFEGATANDFETTLAITDPTADRTITFPDATGTVVLADGSGNVTVSGDLTVSGTTTTINSTTINATTGIVFEGATANAFETTLTVTDPTADRTITFPDATGTVALTSDIAELSQDAIDTALTAGTGITKTYNDGTNTLTIAVDTATITTKNYVDNLVSNHATPTTNVHGIADTSLLATQTYANSAVTTHSNATEAHGATGAVVGTTNTQTLTNKTLTSPKINEDVVLTATATALNYVSGVTSSIQTQLDNKQNIDANVSSVEIGYLNGVTSDIQTQLNNKQPIVANVSDTEIGYLDGVTSAIQTQLDAKAPLASPTFTGTVTLPSGTVTSTMILDGTIANADINASAAIDWTKLGISSTVSSTEIGYVDGVTSAIQTQLDAKAPLASPTFTGTVAAADLTLSGNLTVNGTTTTLNSTTLSVDDKNIELGSVASPSDVTADGGGITLKGATDKTFNWVDATDSWTSSEHINLASGKDLKVNGTAVISSTAGGFIFTDGTQTLEGVPSRTPIIQKTASYTLSSLTERDDLIEVANASATTITIPLNSAVAFPVGTSIDILQTSTGQVTIAGDAGVTVNATPGLKLRTQWSSATLFKRATNTWVVFGDLTA